MGWDRVDQFETVGDNEETLYTVIEEEQTIETTTDDGTVLREQGYVRRFALLDGTPVRRIDAKTFQISTTNEIIRKIG